MSKRWEEKLAGGYLPLFYSLDESRDEQREVFIFGRLKSVDRVRTNEGEIDMKHIA